jgi:hypothetical protein
MPTTIEIILELLKQDGFAAAEGDKGCIMIYNAKTLEEVLFSLERLAPINWNVKMSKTGYACIIGAAGIQQQDPIRHHHHHHN